MFFNKGKKDSATDQAEPVTSNTSDDVARPEDNETTKKKPWWSSIKEPGSALQIITAALLAIAIGMAVTTQVEKVPDAARVIISIPGDLWLRSLKAVGTLLAHFFCSQDSRLTIQYSFAFDHLFYASRCSKTSNHVQWW